MRARNARKARPWTRWRTQSDGRRWAYTQWREGGRIRSEPVGTTLREVAEAHRAARERAMASEAPPDRDPVAALEAFLRSVGMGRSKATVGFYRDHLSRMVAHLAGRPMASWRGIDLEDWIARHPRWTPSTRLKAIQAARRFHRWATDAGLAMGPLAASVARPRLRTPEAAVLDPKAEDALLRAATGTRLHVPILLALRAGLGLGDIRALDWSEVRLSPPPGAIRRERSKTGRPIHVALAPDLRAALVAAKGRTKPAGLVCAMPPTASACGAALRALQAKAKTPAAPRGCNSWHRLRHTFATRLAATGASSSAIGRALGHAHGSRVTLRYVHPDAADVAEAVAKAFGRGR